MAYCPNCGDEVAADAPSCPTCDAVFAAGSAWQPLIEAPPHRDDKRIAELRAEAARRTLDRERLSVQIQSQQMRAMSDAGVLLKVLGLAGGSVVVFVLFVLFAGAASMPGLWLLGACIVFLSWSWRYGLYLYLPMVALAGFASLAFWGKQAGMAGIIGYLAVITAAMPWSVIVLVIDRDGQKLTDAQVMPIFWSFISLNVFLMFVIRWLVERRNRRHRVTE